MEKQDEEDYEEQRDESGEHDVAIVGENAVDEVTQWVGGGGRASRCGTQHYY